MCHFSLGDTSSCRGPHPKLTSHLEEGVQPCIRDSRWGRTGSDQSLVPLGGPAPAQRPRAECFRWHSQREQPFGAILKILPANGAGAGRPSRTVCGHPHRPALSTCRHICQPPAQAKLTSGGFLPSCCPGLREQGLGLILSLLEGPGHLPVVCPTHRTSGVGAVV